MIRMPLLAFIWQGEMKTWVDSSRRSSSMDAESSPPTVMQGRLQTTQRGSSISSPPGACRCTTGSNSVMMWPSTSTAYGTSTVSL